MCYYCFVLFLHCKVGIDFTASNRTFTHKKSLHYLPETAKAASMLAVQRVQALSRGERASDADDYAVDGYDHSDGAAVSPASMEDTIESLVMTGLNDYQKVLLSVGSIIQEYDTDKKFPMMGFGARLRGPTG